MPPTADMQRERLSHIRFLMSYLLCLYELNNLLKFCTRFPFRLCGNLFLPPVARIQSRYPVGHCLELPFQLPGVM